MYERITPCVHVDKIVAFGGKSEKQHRYEKRCFPLRMSKVSFHFICSVISENFLVYFREQPPLELHKWANPSKMWVRPL